MRQDVRLFINDRRVDFAEPFHILMNYILEDVTNPPSLKNNYSKTVKIEGTNNNNKIFSDLWNVQSIAGGKAYDFDLTRKNEFKLYLNGELMETGYVKLDSIVKNGNAMVYYNISLYGGLGDFFYSLSMKDDGERKKLSDLDFGGGEKEFTFEINQKTVSDAWYYLQNNYPSNSLYSKINFAPCRNGVPADWDTRKMMTDMKNNPFQVTPSESGPSSANGVFLAEIQGEREYDEWQAGDFRSYMQRPVLRMKSLVEACCNPNNNGGYQVRLDPTFFNKDNPYYEKTWITLPLLKDTNVQVTDSEGIANSSSKTIVAETMLPIYLPNTTIVEGNNASIEIPYELSISMADPFIDRIINSYKVVNLGLNTEYYTSAFAVQLIAKSGGQIVYGSEIQLISNDFNNFGLSDFGYYPQVDADVVKLKGKFEKDPNNTTFYPFTRTFKIGMKNIKLRAGMTFELQVRKLAKTNLSTTQPFNRMYRSRYPFENPNTPMTQLAIEAPVLCSVKEGTFVQKTETKNTFSKKRMLNTENTPLDYLLDYTKQLGLYFLKDPVKKEISIMTRNTFYNKEDVVVLTDHIDRSKDITIKPLPFDKKWIDFGLKTEKSKFAEQYKNSYDLPYGVKRVDTNYEYDRNVKNLFDKNIYKNAVMVRDFSNYNVNFTSDWMTSPSALPAMTIDGVECHRFLPDLSIDSASAGHRDKTKRSDLPQLYKAKWYDRTPLLCFYDKDRKPVDGSNVLCFFDGMVSNTDAQGKRTRMELTDDTQEMLDLNDNKPCWLYTSDSTHIYDFPLFSRYYTNEKNTVMASWNFANPVETYTYDYNFSDTSSVYDRSWKQFIRDQYSKDTRVLECWVRLERRVMQDYLRKLFFFDGCYWAVTDVIDYDLCGYDMTKCKFIKIQDPDSYINGQKY